MAGCGGWHPLRSLDQEPALLETQGGEGCRETSRQTLIVYYACALNSDREHPLPDIIRRGGASED